MAPVHRWWILNLKYVYNYIVHILHTLQRHYESGTGIFIASHSMFIYFAPMQQHVFCHYPPIRCGSVGSALMDRACTHNRNTGSVRTFHLRSFLFVRSSPPYWHLFAGKVVKMFFFSSFIFFPHICVFIWHSPRGLCTRRTGWFVCAIKLNLPSYSVLTQFLLIVSAAVALCLMWKGM